MKDRGLFSLTLFQASDSLQSTMPCLSISNGRSVNVQGDYGSKNAYLYIVNLMVYLKLANDAVEMLTNDLLQLYFHVYLVTFNFTENVRINSYLKKIDPSLSDVCSWM